MVTKKTPIVLWKFNIFPVLGFTSIDSSAPETNSSDNSPTVSRRNIRISSSKANADSESDSERDTIQRNGKIKILNSALNFVNITF